MPGHLENTRATWVSARRCSARTSCSAVNGTVTRVRVQHPMIAGPAMFTQQQALGHELDPLGLPRPLRVVGYRPPLGLHRHGPEGMGGRRLGDQAIALPGRQRIAGLQFAQVQLRRQAQAVAAQADGERITGGGSSPPAGGRASSSASTRRWTKRPSSV